MFYYQLRASSNCTGKKNTIGVKNYSRTSFVDNGTADIFIAKGIYIWL